jgi:electron transfer flavoprotein beta subunit
MRIVVCLKPVPDPKHWNKLKLDPRTRTLIRTGIPGTINPLDRNALEEALRIREKFGGEAIVVSMAPPDAQPVLKEALAMGADRAVLLSDRVFAGSDTLATAYVLSEAIRKLGDFDLVLYGGTAQVSAQVAEVLGVPSLMHVSAVDARPDGPCLVRSRIEHGYVVVEIRPPMVLSVVKAINEPRYVTLMNILEAEGKDLAVWSSQDITLREPWVGLHGSPTQMADLLTPERKGKAEMLPGPPADQARALADRLHRLGFC